MSRCYWSPPYLPRPVAEELGYDYVEAEVALQGEW